MRIQRLAVLLLALCATFASAQANWNTPTAPFHVIDNVYYVGTEGLSAFLVTTPAGHVLIDGTTEPGAALVEAGIAQLGFRLADVKILLNSHAHFDHSGGLARLRRDTGAQLVAMEGDVSALEGGFYLGSEEDESMRAPPVTVDRVVQDGAVVELGGVRLTAVHTPGHSRGCTSWSLPVRHEGRVLQALVFCSATVAANRITPPLQYPGIVEDYRRTFARAKTLQVDVPLAPHPEFFDLLPKAQAAREQPQAPNPFVDPAAFAPFIGTLEQAFERTLRERSGAQAPAQP